MRTLCRRQGTNNHVPPTTPRPRHLVGVPADPQASEMSTTMATPSLTAAVSTAIERLRRQSPVRRVTMANDLQRQLTEAQMAVTQEKTAAVRELRSQGYKLQDIANMLDVSVGRVKQIEEGGRSAKGGGS